MRKGGEDGEMRDGEPFNFFNYFNLTSTLLFSSLLSSLSQFRSLMTTSLTLTHIAFSRTNTKEQKKTRKRKERRKITFWNFESPFDAMT